MKSIPFYLTLLILCISSLINCNEIKHRSFTGFNGTIAAFGDFNSDKFTDIFLIRNDIKGQYCFKILFQIPEKTEQDKDIFKQDEKLKKLCVHYKIISIIPSDFDGDALMDVAIVMKLNEDTTDPQYKILIFKGTKSDIEKDKALFKTTTNVISQPMLLDYNGDMISDLLVAEKGEDGKVSYQVYLGGSFEKKPFDLERKADDIHIGDSNSNAFIDLNKDGVADIFIEEKGAMYYYFAGKEGYYSASQRPYKINYPKHEIVGSSTFCDINNDEYIDHLVPVCKKKDDKKSCSIIVRDRMNDNWTELVNEIKVNDDYFYFDEITSHGIKLPIRLRHGYVNENGYTDLMALMKSSKNEKWHIVLFNNRRDENKPNELNISFKITALNESIADEPILATFFDLYEDGVIDILVNHKKPNSNVNEFQALTLNAFADVNFVKILVTSGLCTDGKCYEKGTYGEDTYLTPYGTNTPGSSVCYQLVNSNSNAMKSCAGQLSQSSHFALQMPYTFFGLGLYINYIERLNITIPSGNTTQPLSRMVEQIVPDSQIVVIPNPIGNPASWKIKLFLTPSDIIFKTLYTLVAICVLLIVFIIFLHRKEMLEDVEEQKLFKKQWPEFRR